VSDETNYFYIYNLKLNLNINIILYLPFKILHLWFIKNISLYYKSINQSKILKNMTKIIEIYKNSLKAITVIIQFGYIVSRSCLKSTKIQL